MLEVIERGGIAAYIRVNEMVIDAALIRGHRLRRKLIYWHETKEGNAVDLRHMQARSSTRYLRLPYMVEELGDSRAIKHACWQENGS